VTVAGNLLAEQFVFQQVGLVQLLKLAFSAKLPKLCDPRRIVIPYAVPARATHARMTLRIDTRIGICLGKTILTLRMNLHHGFLK